MSLSFSSESDLFGEDSNDDFVPPTSYEDSSSGEEFHEKK